MWAYEMSYSVIGCPMTDAILCKDCLSGSGKPIRMTDTDDGCTRYCDACGIRLGVVAVSK